MAGQFIPETVIFETIDVGHPATPRQCGLCNQNPPTFAYRFGKFTDGSRRGLPYLAELDSSHMFWHK